MKDQLFKYYTKENIVKLCYDEIKQNIKISKEEDLIIEPSAGDGSFINIIKELSDKHEFYDIKPENEEIIKMNFLEYNYDGEYKNVHVIGNPPFGKNSSLAKKFIRKCCTFANTISFILPKSFKKESFIKTFDLYFHLIKIIDIPENSFLYENEDYDVPCIFMIWEKKSEKRTVEEKYTTDDFVFVKKTENPDLSIRRVGFYAGKADTEFESKSIQSHYFIKINNNKKETIDKLKNLKFDHDNTTGPRSVSKNELLKNYISQK